MNPFIFVSLLVSILSVALEVCCNDHVNNIPIKEEQISQTANPTVLYIPLDERYTTRDAFLNLAKVTPYNVITPPTDMICHMKEPANLTALQEFIEDNLPNADILIISVELYLYGGLIPSRSSNDSYEQILERVETLVSYKQLYPNLTIYLATVVMRIPAYNEDVEEPWYWAYYGRDLFQYSYYEDWYKQTGNQSYEEIAQQYKAKVPADIVEEFVWRRQRNHNITVALVNTQYDWYTSKNTLLFQHMFITQDDNAKYGFNIDEANNLRALVTKYQLNDLIDIYPGADEVGFTMIARAASDVNGRSPTLYLVYRDPNTINYIPNYEGQPMVQTLMDQIGAAGGTVITNSDDADILLFVNNFSTKTQLEADEQPEGGDLTDFEPFLQYLDPQRIIGFADNRYSNGADRLLIEWMAYRATNEGDLQIGNFGYAGWNTDGNTLGTVISNVILLSFYQNPDANGAFNTLRILEDCFYQADVRTEFINYVQNVTGDDINNLATDLNFYTRYIYKRLNSDYLMINNIYGTTYQLDDIYFPWNRTFEVGFNEPTMDLYNIFT